MLGKELDKHSTENGGRQPNAGIYRLGLTPFTERAGLTFLSPSLFDSLQSVRYVLSSFPCSSSLVVCLLPFTPSPFSICLGYTDITETGLT